MNFSKFNKETIMHYGLISVSLLIAIGLTTFLLKRYFSALDFPNTAGDLGTFGDYLGGLLNPTIAGLALIWLIRSVSLQVKELKKTNEALESTVITAKQQQHQISIQNFENLFFELMKVKSDATNEIIFREAGDISGSPPLTGKNAIKKYILLFKESSSEWEPFYTTNLLDIFGSYFRVCYQIVKLIDNNPTLNELEKAPGRPYTVKQKEYFDLFRSTLTQFELEAFFFNCLSTYGKGKFKTLIEKYGLFEPLLLQYNDGEDNLKQPVNYAYMYDLKAFERNHNWIAYFIHIASINKSIDLKLLKNQIFILNSYNHLYSISRRVSTHITYDNYQERFESFLDEYAIDYEDFDFDDYENLSKSSRLAYSIYKALKHKGFSKDAYLIKKYEINPEDFLSFNKPN
ncbi:putative phage abortive infection protein [Acinetobacter courvalinii]|uniref:putative phage abortive infection protein n=1 Tax=Acinetobacter courvalinii TaxID=280147 RepID=UPI00190080FA|nr:putative phage abortive infection protein [Acinetobacter courvalinii]MBJ8418786.1 hypothetical protein [Acinetobacter courvalinii]